MAKVTVYIPTYNYGRYLDKAIQSVLNQTMDDWELIVIDDGSTDNTMEVLVEYNNHPKIRIVKQENKGLSVTNNIALRISNGEYIIRLDADDYFDENILLILSNILDTKPEIGLVYSDYYHINENDEVIEIIRRKKIGKETVLLDLPAHGACTMIRKECLLDLKGYQEEFSCQDGYDLWLRFIKRFKVYNVNNPLFYYRQHPKSLTKNQEKIIETRRKIKRKFAENINTGKMPKVLGIIPVVRRSIYSQSEPFVKLAGRPLIWYTLKEVQNSKTLDQIVLSSEDDEVLEYGNQFPNIVTLKRPNKLADYTSRAEDVVNHVLYSLKKSSGYEPDAVCVLYITTPLRKAYHIDKAVNTLSIFDVDSVISIQEELSYCYFHRKFGLTPISKSARNLRVERDAIYKENGAIYLSKVNVIKEGRLLGKRISHIVMLPEESVKINSKLELWMAEKIITEWEQIKDKMQMLK